MVWVTAMAWGVMGWVTAVIGYGYPCYGGYGMGGMGYGYPYYGYGGGYGYGYPYYGGYGMGGYGMGGYGYPLTTAGYYAPAGGFGYSSAYVAPGHRRCDHDDRAKAVTWGSTRSQWLTPTVFVA